MFLWLPTRFSQSAALGDADIVYVFTQKLLLLDPRMISVAAYCLVQRLLLRLNTASGGLYRVRPAVGSVSSVVQEKDIKIPKIILKTTRELPGMEFLWRVCLQVCHCGLRVCTR